MPGLKLLEDENARLKKIVAVLTLNREMMQDVIRRIPKAGCTRVHPRQEKEICKRVEDVRTSDRLLVSLKTRMTKEC